MSSEIERQVSWRTNVITGRACNFTQLSFRQEMENVSSKVLFNVFTGVSFTGEEFMQVFMNLDKNL